MPNVLKHGIRIYRLIEFFLFRNVSPNSTPNTLFQLLFFTDHGHILDFFQIFIMGGTSLKVPTFLVFLDTICTLYKTVIRLVIDFLSLLSIFHDCLYYVSKNWYA